MACFELVAAFLVVHFYSIEEDVDSDSGLADRLVAAAVEVYTVAEGLAAGVTSVSFGQPVHSGVVLDAVLPVVADSAYCLVQQALDNP